MTPIEITAALTSLGFAWCVYCQARRITHAERRVAVLEKRSEGLEKELERREQ